MSIVEDRDWITPCVISSHRRTETGSRRWFKALQNVGRIRIKVVPQKPSPNPTLYCRVSPLTKHQHSFETGDQIKSDIRTLRELFRYWLVNYFSYS